MTEDNEDVTHVSNSEIGTFKRCRRKWWLGYFRKLRINKDYKTGALILGSRVHEALATYYDLTPGDPIAKIKELYEIARNELDPEDISTLEDLNKEATLAVIMVEGYMEWLEESGADDGLEVLSTETELSVPFKGLPVVLLAKLDTRILRHSDNRLLSMDHKTTASFGAITKTSQMAEQPLTYELVEKLLSEHDGQYVTGGIFNMLRKVKRTATAQPPFYMREYLYHNEYELRNFWYRLYGTLTTMLEVEKQLNQGMPHHIAVYPTPTRDCSWDCDFYAICPMFDDGSNVEGAIEAGYTVHNPYARYESGVV